MAKGWCLLAMEKITCFGLQRPSSGFHNFLAKEFYIICLNRVAMLRSHHHLRACVKLSLVGCILCQWTQQTSHQTQLNKHANDGEILKSPRGLGILYKFSLLGVPSRCACIVNRIRFLFSLAQHFYYKLVKVTFCYSFSLTTCFDSTKESSSGCCLT